MLKKKFKIITVLMLLYGSFLAVFQDITTYAAERFLSQGNKPPEGATCYAVGPMMTPKEDLENQKYQLKLLEEQYKKKQITQQAYDTRKKDVLKRIQELEKKSKPK